MGWSAWEIGFHRWVLSVQEPELVTLVNSGNPGDDFPEGMHGSAWQPGMTALFWGPALEWCCNFCFPAAVILGELFPHPSCFVSSLHFPLQVSLRECFGSISPSRVHVVTDHGCIRIGGGRPNLLKTLHFHPRARRLIIPSPGKEGMGTEKTEGNHFYGGRLPQENSAAYVMHKGLYFTIWRTQGPPNHLFQNRISVDEHVERADSKDSSFR